MPFCFISFPSAARTKLRHRRDSHVRRLSNETSKRPDASALGASNSSAQAHKVCIREQSHAFLSHATYRRGLRKDCGRITWGVDISWRGTVPISSTQAAQVMPQTGSLNKSGLRPLNLCSLVAVPWDVLLTEGGRPGLGLVPCERNRRMLSVTRNISVTPNPKHKPELRAPRLPLSTTLVLHLGAHTGGERTPTGRRFSPSLPSPSDN